ncbi:MAG: hypothetical protein AAB441_03705 [Patescibacteria group bacterium]
MEIVAKLTETPQFFIASLSLLISAIFFVTFKVDNYADRKKRNKKIDKNRK